MKSILIIDNNSSYIGQIKKISKINREIKISTISYDLLQNLDNEQINQFDLLILSGGKLPSVGSFITKIKVEIDLIKKTQIPTIGICYGAELIAISFDCKIELLGKNKGIDEVEIIKNDPIFSPLVQGERFAVWQEHKYGITQLSDNMEGLGRSVSSNFWHIFKHKQKFLYGLQFHPELQTEQAFGDEIMINLLNLAFD
jgi:GMP synthase (glutamine-hydrolysing)